VPLSKSHSSCHAQVDSEKAYQLLTSHNFEQQSAEKSINAFTALSESA